MPHFPLKLKDEMPQVQRRGSRRRAVLSALPCHAALRMPRLQTRTAPGRQMRKVRRGFPEIYFVGDRRTKSRGRFAARSPRATLHAAEKYPAYTVNTRHSSLQAIARRRPLPQRSVELPFVSRACRADRRAASQRGGLLRKATSVMRNWRLRRLQYSVSGAPASCRQVLEFGLAPAPVAKTKATST